MPKQFVSEEEERRGNSKRKIEKLRKDPKASQLPQRPLDKGGEFKLGYQGQVRMHLHNARC
jgi:hypothetical protein